MAKAFLNLRLLLLLCLSFALTNCTTQPRPEIFDIHAFGTKISITVIASAQQTQQAKRLLKETFDKLHKQWHAWQEPSLLTQINHAISLDQGIKLDESVKQLLTRITLLSNQSNQLFNPAIGHLINVWGFQNDLWEGPPPTRSVIDKLLLAAPSLNDLYWNETTLASKNNQVKLDLGGVAKGYAAGIIRKQLRQMGIENALINIGGDVSVLGQHYDQPWRIGVKDPANTHQAALVLEACDGDNIFTSGTYERQYQWQQQPIHHILDPRTGFPAKGWLSVTVIHSDPLTADVGATALLIAGKDWQQVAQNLNLTSLVLMDHKGNVIHEKINSKMECSI